MVKRIFGIIKYQFEIFEKSLKYTLQIQIDFIFAVMAFYSFIIINFINLIFIIKKHKL